MSTLVTDPHNHGHAFALIQNHLAGQMYSIALGSRSCHFAGYQRRSFYVTEFKGKQSWIGRGLMGSSTIPFFVDRQGPLGKSYHNYFLYHKGTYESQVYGISGILGLRD